VICTRCGEEIGESEGFFTEGDNQYHEGCYADKQWDELNAETKEKWEGAMKQQIRAIKQIEDPETRKSTLDDYVKRCIPTQIRDEILAE